ncbi:MAG TPA: hypothetical protein VLA95_02805 [Gemmatimonadales bacterium]|nr:hypothetical protein [Gemmatimonadales bacterium]
MKAPDPTDPISAIFPLSPDIRYVAILRDGSLTLRERGGLANASSAESDRYEELLVNPTLLTLVGQRGRIDCGGLEYVMIRYGSFFQLVRPIPGGHVSVAVEPHGNPLAVATALAETLPALFGTAESRG